MKNSFALALASASCFSLTLGWQSALAQAAEYASQGQGASGTDQSQSLAAGSVKASPVLSPYQMQEQAIKNGLAANAAPPPVLESYNPEATSTWGSAPKPGSVSKIKGVAAAASRAIGRTAAMTASVALPAAGMVLLGTALTRGAMTTMNSGRRPGFAGNSFSGNQYGGNPYNQPGMNGWPNNATSNLTGGPFSNNVYPYHNGW